MSDAISSICSAVIMAFASDFQQNRPPVRTLRRIAALSRYRAVNLADSRSIEDRRVNLYFTVIEKQGQRDEQFLHESGAPPVVWQFRPVEQVVSVPAHRGDGRIPISSR
jgi:hypothetical protein